MVVAAVLVPAVPGFESDVVLAVTVLVVKVLVVAALEVKVVVKVLVEVLVVVVELGPMMRVMLGMDSGGLGSP